MKLVRTMIAVVAVILGMWSLAPPAQAAAPLPMFKQMHPEIGGDKARFLQELMTGLRDSNLTVGAFNRQFGPHLPSRPETLQAFVLLLQDDRFQMRPCEGSVKNYGLSGGFMVVVERQCYQGEWMLVDTKTGIRLFSSYCGNLQVALPPPKQHFPLGVSYGITKCAYHTFLGFCRDAIHVIRDGNRQVGAAYVD